MPKMIIFSLAWVVLFGNEAVRAELPIDPINETFLVVIPAAYDPAIVPPNLETEFGAFWKLQKEANSSGNYEINVGLYAYIDNNGSYMDNKNFGGLVNFLSGFGPAVNLSWGEHHLTFRNVEYDNYLTVDSWREASWDSCMIRGRVIVREYQDHGVDGLPLVFDMVRHHGVAVEHELVRSAVFHVVVAQGAEITEFLPVVCKEILSIVCPPHHVEERVRPQHESTRNTHSA